MSNAPVIFYKKPENMVFCEAMTRVSKINMTVNMTRVPMI